ncbi:MAG: Thermophilic serine proteinase [Syntrophomonadaceae bacterium]|nr:Thermophilic serine proteinase [Bacillota bacterium]
MRVRLKALIIIVIFSCAVFFLKSYGGGEETSPAVQNKEPETQQSSSALSSNATMKWAQTASKEDFKKVRRFEYVPGEILIKFKPSLKVQATAVSIKASEAGVPAVLKQAFQKLNVHHLKITDPNLTVEDAIKKLTAHPDVEYAEPNYIFHALLTPNDTSFGQLWGLHNIGQVVNGSAGILDADMDVPEAWDITTGSSSVVIAVVDTGVDYNHPDLSANIWTNTGETNCSDGIDNDRNGYIDDCRGWDFVDNDNDPMDYNKHGTHVAGTIAAVGNNDLGIAGVNWTAKIMPLRFLDTLGSGTTVNAISAILYANAKGAHIINNSWGGGGFSQSLKAVIDASSAIVVCAAGNDTSNNDLFPIYPASYASSNIISVAATDQNDTLAMFSNYGPISVDVAAPGVNIYSTIPAREIVFSDNFDSAFTWATGGTNNTWAVTAELSKSAPNSLTDSPRANYLSGTSSWARSPVINLSGKKGCTLSYYMEWDVDPTDNICTQASTDGTTWTNLPDSCRSGTSSRRFEKFPYDLKNYDNQATVYIRFLLTSDASATNAGGVHIDDLTIKCASTTYTGTEYDYSMGTSMAAPHVSGLAGMIKAQYPSMTNLQIKDVILNSVDAKSSLRGKVLKEGRVNAYSAFSSLPAAPISLLASTGSSAGMITLTWADNSFNESGFRIERKTGASGTYSEVTTVGSNITIYHDLGLAAGTTYYYRIRAYNHAGNSTYSNEASATTVSTSGSISNYPSGGCFIATAVYGSYLDPHVMVLREFRDKWLTNSFKFQVSGFKFEIPNVIGKTFVAFYYRTSPPIADFISQHEGLRTASRWALTPVVYIVKYPLSLGFVLLIGGVIIALRRVKN